MIDIVVISTAAFIASGILVLTWMFLQNYSQQSGSKERTRTKKCRPPPVAPFSALHTVLQMSHAKNIVNLRFFKDIAASFKPTDFGATEYGATFRVRLPSLLPPWGRYLTFSTDYKLVRKVLCGSSSSSNNNSNNSSSEEEEQQLPEAEKSDMMKIFNFVDRSVNNIISDKTSSSSRERARKAVAQSFSTINLQRTWPHLQRVLEQQFTEFEQLAAAHSSFQVKELMMRFFFSALFTASFAVPVNLDGEERCDSINGVKYMQQQDAVAFERPKEMLLPLRRFWIWDSDVRAAAAGCDYLKQQAQKVVHLHQQQQQQQLTPAEATAGSGSGKSGKVAYSLLDHLMNHAYSSDTHRLSDLNILIFGGHETTAVTFSCLLIEIARNPHVKAQLQQEIDAIMPLHPPHHRHKQQQQQQNNSDDNSVSSGLQHGDAKLISAITNLPYLNLCIKEVLRLWPAAAGGVARDLLVDLQHGDLLLQRGSYFNPHFFSMFRSPLLHRAEEFLPERWQENSAELPLLRELVIPFSLGRRNCVGQNMAQFQLRLVTAYFLRYFDFELLEEPTFEYFITIKPDHAPMRVSLREPL